MSSHSVRRSNSLIRTIILFSSVLAIVGVLFAIVQYMSDTGEGVAKRPTTRPALATRPIEPGRGDAEPGLTIREDLPKIVGTQGKSSIRIYSPDSNVARMEILVREWKPTGRRPEEFEVIEPEIRFRTPGGQEVRVVADRGLVEMKKADGGAYDPRRGRLEGHVVLEMDRLSARDRKAMPPDLRNAAPTPDRLVRAELEDIEFDLETSRIQTPGRFRARAVEGELEGIGLLVRYDESNGRVERVEIDRGVQIALRRSKRTLQIALPGSPVARPLPAGSGSPPAQPVRSSAATRPATDSDGLPILAADEPRKTKERPVETYRAKFEGDVAVEETDPAGAVSKLECRTLEFLFDIGRTQRAAADEGRTGARPAAAPGEPESQVLLTWSGRFSVDFEAAAEAEATGNRVHVIAVGEPTYVQNTRLGKAVCAELEYHNESERVWLRSAAGGEEVSVSSAGAGQITGREVFFDRQAGRLKVVGPGQLTGRRAASDLLSRSSRTPPRTAQEGGMGVRFAQELTATLEKTIREQADEASGQTLVVEDEYLRSARFLGEVVMSQDEDSIAGDEVVMKFVPRDGQGPGGVEIEHLTASGNVRMTHGPDRIACGAIDVEVAPDERGRFSPRHARAEGGVMASRDDRQISASQAMLVDLRLYERPRLPFDMTRARAKAMAGGIDPDTVDWDQERVRYEQEKAYEPGLKRLQAFGDVIVRDPKQGLNVSAAVLDCTFTDEGQPDRPQQIDKARVSGDPDGSPASVEIGDFAIQGRLIDVDAATGRQFAQVPGAGRLTFKSRTDLDGRDMETPVPIAVTWTDQMEFRGEANRATFVGGVHAASEGSALDCRHLTVGFEDIAPVAQAPPTGDKWWIFSLLMDRRDSGRDDVGLAGPRMAKRAVYLSATGGAVAVTSNMDESGATATNRARLSGEQIDLDLKRKLATIDAAGKLLIEDYKARKGASAGPAGRTNPFGALGGDEPSQTYLAWAGSMSYDFRYQTANFDRDVLMRHLTGSRMLLGDRVAPGAAFDKPVEAADGKGRDAVLRCKSLFIQFQRDAKEGTEARPGLGSLSGFALDKFQAESNVYFVDSGVSVTAARVTYDQDKTLLSIFGNPAQVIDERSSRMISWRGPLIYWDRARNIIEAPEKSGIFTR